MLLLQLEIGLDVVAEAARAAAASGVRVVLNTAPFAALPPEVLALADPVVANASEAAEMAASGARTEHLLVTRGADGSQWGNLRLRQSCAGLQGRATSLCRRSQEKLNREPPRWTKRSSTTC